MDVAGRRPWVIVNEGDLTGAIGTSLRSVGAMNLIASPRLTIGAELELTHESTNLGRTRVSSAMTEVGAVMSVLSPDPRRNDVDFTGELFVVLPERFTGITANAVGLLHASRRSAAAAARFAMDGRDQLRAYVAVRRKRWRGSRRRRRHRFTTYATTQRGSTDYLCLCIW